MRIFNRPEMVVVLVEESVSRKACFIGEQHHVEIGHFDIICLVPRKQHGLGNLPLPRHGPSVHDKDGTWFREPLSKQNCHEY